MNFLLTPAGKGCILLCWRRSRGDKLGFRCLLYHEFAKIEEKYLTRAFFFATISPVPCEEYAMRLNLQQIMHVPGASIPFAFQLDLSQEAFFGEYPISRPVTVTGHVKNVADVLIQPGEGGQPALPLGGDAGGRGRRHCPAGPGRGRCGGTGLHGLHSRYGHKTFMLRRLQGTLPRLRRQPEPGALPV